VYFSGLYECPESPVYCLGHYSSVDGSFERDVSPTGSVVVCGTYDVVDTCIKCGLELL
jgi:hypothetical protein